MRFSYEMIPEHPVRELIEAIELADQLGFYACYGADATSHKDMWEIFAAAAARTRRIRLAPGVTHVILKEPTIIAQQIATLDELTNGRAEVVFSFGSIAMLEQYNIEWKGTRPMARLREAHRVMRTFLDEGTIDFQGDFYKYTGLFTAARPVQERVPIKMGAMGGPRSFELAGEIADGMHTAYAYSPEALRYAAEHVRIGAERAGRDWRELDLGDCIVGAISTDSMAAKQVARGVAAFSISSTPPELIERNGIKYESVQPILDAFASSDIERALELTTPELAAKLSITGTPEDWVEKIRADIVPSGFNHVIIGLVDPYLVHHFSGTTVENVPDLKGQLRLIHDHVMPAFA